MIEILIAMNVCYLYMICNFEIFSTVNSSMHPRWLPKWKILFIDYIKQFFLKNRHIFAIWRFRHHLVCIT